MPPMKPGIMTGAIVIFVVVLAVLGALLVVAHGNDDWRVHRLRPIENRRGRTHRGSPIHDDRRQTGRRVIDDRWSASRRWRRIHRNGRREWHADGEVDGHARVGGNRVRRAEATVERPMNVLSFIRGRFDCTGTNGFKTGPLIKVGGSLTGLMEAARSGENYGTCI